MTNPTDKLGPRPIGVAFGDNVIGYLYADKDWLERALAESVGLLEESSTWHMEHTESCLAAYKPSNECNCGLRDLLYRITNHLRAVKGE